MSHRVLMVAFHYPPCSGTSGVQRALKFSRYLPRHGWDPIVLTAQPSAYRQRDDAQLGEIDSRIEVARAIALDAAHHLAIRGRYPRLLAVPDRWASWSLAAVLRGLWLIRRRSPLAIWSTYPIATAHFIAFALHRLSGLPWIADLRDPMTEDDYPSDTFVRASHDWIEKRVMTHAARVLFTTPSCREMYLKRYPRLGPERSLLVPNGYDEEDFVGMDFSALPRLASGPLRLLHAGMLYPEERDPRQLFRALARLKKDGAIGSRSLRIDLRAPGFDGHYAALLAELGIADIVHILPPVSHHASLLDCAAADALLLMQGASCNRQIPAKTYEYLRIGKPVLALTDPAGDTAELLRATGGASVVALEAEESMYSRLPRFLEEVRSRVHPLPDAGVVRQYSRREQTRILADCLRGVSASRSAPMLRAS